MNRLVQPGGPSAEKADSLMPAGLTSCDLQKGLNNHLAVAGVQPMTNRFPLFHPCPQALISTRCKDIFQYTRIQDSRHYSVLFLLSSLSLSILFMVSEPTAW